MKIQDKHPQNSESRVMDVYARLEEILIRAEGKEIRQQNKRNGYG